MNKTHILITAALASLTVSTASFASPGESVVAQSAVTAKPVPVTIVSPTNLPRDFKATTVELLLTIDEKGVPHDIKPAKWMPRDLAARLVPTIAKWRFTPNYVNGKAVPARFVLPLELTAGA